MNEKMLNNGYSVVFSTNQNASKKPVVTIASRFSVLTNRNAGSRDEIEVMNRSINGRMDRMNE